MEKEMIDPETGEVLSEPVNKKLRIMRPYERNRVKKIFKKETRTKASMAEECNINKIMAKYQKFGTLPPSNDTGRFGDFTKVGDYHSAMNAVVEAQQQFMELPSSLRKRFANDPALLLEFLSDPDNYDEAVRLGLVTVPEQNGEVPEEPEIEEAQEPPERPD